MKIVHVLPGSGDSFYCENCVRDNAMVRALVAAGEKVIAAPLYLPQIIDPVATVAASPIFFGGINSYLQQKSRFFRWTPRWLDRIFDSRGLLRAAARRAGSVRASELGDMTLSMLRGADGNQKKELERLVTWLESMDRPDVVHISNPLLLGVGEEIKRRLNVPLVCSLQDEDDWVDAMHRHDAEQCWEMMAGCARNVDAFIAVSHYFSGVMRDKLRLDPRRLHVVHIGIDADEFQPASRDELQPASPDEGPPTIGYLARMTESLGLGVLVDAFLELKAGDGLRDLRLHVSGGSTRDDSAFLAELRGRVAAAGAADDVRFFEAIDLAARHEFFESLTVLSVPTPHGRAFGTYLLEAMASGVPVVQPRRGSFPELIEATGGGVLYDGHDAASLAGALRAALEDRAGLAEMARRGRQSVRERFNLATMAERLIQVYRGAIAAPTAAAVDSGRST